MTFRRLTDRVLALQLLRERVDRRVAVSTDASRSNADYSLPNSQVSSRQPDAYAVAETTRAGGP